MSTTQIPPANPAPSTPPARPPEGGDLYDARYWESAYREIVEAPALIIKLQDDLSQARRREAFWISVCVHLVVVLLLWNSQKLAGFMPRRAVVVVSPESSQKDLTYLELPPDEQKVTKRPDTNIISDKDRVATSHAPQLDRQELKKILESSRPGRPAPSAAQTPQPQSAPPAPAAGQSAAPEPSAPPAPAPPAAAKLQSPQPALSAKAAFGSADLSPGSAIRQAERAAAANRGGYNGDGGSYGVLGQGRKPTAAMGPLEVLSDTMGVDFTPYLQRVLHDVRMNWYNLIPESARAPLMKKGKVTIEFAILKDGTVAGMKLVSTSGDVALDRGAWGGITASNPFPPLPTEFGGQFLGLRFAFYYNPDRSDLQ
jgi:TonB family protein